MVAAFLLVSNIIVVTLLVILMTTYMTHYYWWLTHEGRVVVGGLFCALLVGTGGLFERFNMIAAHDVFKSLGYCGASIVLILATRHVVRVELGLDKPKA